MHEVVPYELNVIRSGNCFCFPRVSRNHRDAFLGRFNNRMHVQKASRYVSKPVRRLYGQASCFQIARMVDSVDPHHHRESKAVIFDFEDFLEGFLERDRSVIEWLAWQVTKVLRLWWRPICCAV